VPVHGSLGWSQRLPAPLKRPSRPEPLRAAEPPQNGLPDRHPNPAALPDSGGSILHRLLQDVVEEPFGVAVLRSPFRTERRPLLYLSQGREQHAVQFPRAGFFHLGFDNELVALFRDGVLRGQLLRGESDRLAFPTTASREAFLLGGWGLG